MMSSRANTRPICAYLFNGNQKLKLIIVFLLSYKIWRQKAQITAVLKCLTSLNMALTTDNSCA